MNLLLHGLDAPQIDPGNALALQAFRDRRERSRRRDPHQPAVRRRGGEGHTGQFPGRSPDGRNGAAFPATHHAKAARQPTLAGRPARAAVVVPNGTLFGDGVCARIKEELLKEFNLHTIVRLPNGVFAPYTGIPTNILFFDRSGPTREVWYYEQPLPEGRKNYTKTAPIQFEEFAPLWSGGTSARKRIRHGKCRPTNCWPTAATSTARTRALRIKRNIDRRKCLRPRY